MRFMNERFRKTGNKMTYNYRSLHCSYNADIGIVPTCYIVKISSNLTSFHNFKCQA